MIDSKIETYFKEYQDTITKTLDVFKKENYGQVITQWNFTTLQQVMNNAFIELKQKVNEALQDPKTEE